MAETTLLDIDFGDVFEQITKIKNATAELRAENDKLAESIDKTGDESGETAKQMQMNEAQIRSLTKEQRTLNKLVDDSIKAQKAEKGSIEANRAELSKLTAEYIKLAKPTQEQTARIKALSDTLKKQEAALGDTRRNVGNYQAAVEGALKNVRLFGVSVGDTIGALKQKKAELTLVGNSLGGVDFSLKGVTNGLKLFRIALISTGIGLLIAALGSMVALFLKSETGMNLVNKAMNVFNAIIDVGVKRVEQFVKGISLFLDGKFDESIKTISASFTGLTTEIKAASAAASDLSNAQKALEDDEAAFIRRRGQITRQIAELRDTANDETKTYIERKNALQEALVLQAELIGKEDEFGKRRAANAQQQFDISAQTTEDLKILNQTLEDADEQAAQRLKEKRKLDNELQALNNKNASDQKANLKDLAAQEEALKKKREKDLKDRLAESEAYFAEQELIEAENFSKKIISQEELNKRLAELKRDEFLDQIEILETFGAETLEKEAELNQLLADQKIALREKDLEHQKEIAERVKELNQELVEAEFQVQEAKVDLAQASFNIIEEFAKEESVLGRLAFLGSKGAALADVIVQAQKGFAGIAANLAMIPPILPPAIPNPAYPIAVALAVKEKIALGIQTGISLATIGAQTVKGFLAQGGELKRLDDGGKVLHIGGRPHAAGGTEIALDGTPVAVAEKDEKMFILKKSASDFIEKYSMINQLFGGKSWTGQPVRHAASGGQIATTFDGGFGARQSSLNVEQQIAQEMLANAIRNMPQPVVRVTEINRVQKSTQSSVEVSEL